MAQRHEKTRKNIDSQNHCNNAFEIIKQYFECSKRPRPSISRCPSLVSSSRRRRRRRGSSSSSGSGSGSRSRSGSQSESSSSSSSSGSSNR